MQAPLIHSVPVAQTVPHPPQLFGSLVTSTQVTSQKVCPEGHWQVPPVQLRFPQHGSVGSQGAVSGRQAVPLQVPPLTSMKSRGWLAWALMHALSLTLSST
jgi:hypothetical protein